MRLIAFPISCESDHTKNAAMKAAGTSMSTNWKVEEYIAAGLIEAEQKDGYVQTFEQMQGVLRDYNVHNDPAVGDCAGASAESTAMMTPEELRAELQRRELLLQMGQDGRDGQVTDQWRVYTEVIERLQEKKKLLRIVIQASAGTSKSFLLETNFPLVHFARARR